MGKLGSHFGDQFGHFKEAAIEIGDHLQQIQALFGIPARHNREALMESPKLGQDDVARLVGGFKALQGGCGGAGEGTDYWAGGCHLDGSS